MNSSRFWGGGEQWHFRTATLLAAAGYNIFVFCSPGSVLQQRLREQPRITTITLRVSNLSFLNPFKIAQLARLLTRTKIDTVIANSPNDVKLAGLSVFLQKRTRLIFRRGLPHPLKNSFINRFLFHRCVNLVIANSLDVKQSLNAHNPQLVAQERIVVIHNGIDIDAFERRNCKPVAQRTDGVIHLGNGGRLVEQKNQRDLLFLAQRLKQQGVRFKMFIAGTGKLEQELKQLANDRQVDDCVVFVGFLENIKDLLAGIDIFVFPSKFEGMSNMLIESLAAGKPVVAYDASSNAEVISHGVTGYLAPVGEVTRLADYCQKLAQDPTLRTRMSDNCRRIAREQFSEQMVLGRLTPLL